ncbi:hypothetical protein CCP4SC76_2470015 [Gammaproteobacteria bacterium]
MKSSLVFILEINNMQQTLNADHSLKFSMKVIVTQQKHQVTNSKFRP